MFHKKECFLQKLMDFSQKTKKKLIPKFMAKVIKFPTKKVDNNYCNSIKNFR